MSGPLVSVVIPTYNRAAEVCSAIDNALGQTYQNIEIIVVDDGSTDDTQARLKSYGDRIRVVAKENGGPAVARNRGAAIARGEIIAFQDDDDLWEPTKLERQVALLQKFGPEVVCCLCNIAMPAAKGKKPTSFDDSLVHPQHEEGIWTNVLEVLATRFILFTQAVAIRRDVFERVGGFREDIKYDEDYDLALRLALEGPWAFIKEPLVTYTHGADNSFSQAAVKDPITLKECEVKIVEHVLTRLHGSDQAAVRMYLNRRLKRFRRGMTQIKLSRNDFWGARQLARLMKTLSHYQEAAFRRTPWYPKALTLPAESVASHPGSAKEFASVSN
jgi:glycosyltransferase involved in cell wall biosynthesis